jgi:hypothetical protein
MKLEVKRFSDDGETTISAFFIDGIFQCFGIEDQEQKGCKISGETRVPNGTFKVGLRKEGGYHAKYAKKYGAMHKGMLCIYNADNWKIDTGTHDFQYVLIHTGNTDDHTAGCYLVNFLADSLTFTGGNSVSAYRKIYPPIAEAIESGEEVLITYTDIETGK